MYCVGNNVTINRQHAALLHGECNSVQYDNHDFDERLDQLLAKGSGQRDVKSANHSRVTFAAPIKLTDSNFEHAVQKYPLLVVDFWAPWCGPCRMLTPIIDQLASEMAGKVVFGKLNVDENPRIASEFGVQSIPTVIVFKNGDVADGFRGVAPKAQIKAMITTIMV